MTNMQRRMDRQMKHYVNALEESSIISVTNQKGAIIYVNEKFCQICGYSREELLGRNHNLLNSKYHPTAYFDKMWATIRQGKIWRGEIRNKAKDGAFYWVMMTIVPSLDSKGQPTSFIAIDHEITERKIAEETILEQKYLLEQSYDAIFTWDIDDGISYWNQSAEKLFGYTEAEVRGLLSYKLLKPVFPQPILDLRNTLKKQGSWEGELVYTTKQGMEIIVESRFITLKRNNGKMIVLETCRDITDRKRLEGELSRIAQLSLVGEVAAGLAHEIKNPLAGIKGVIDIILQQKTPRPDEHELLENVRHEIVRIDQTVRTLLHHARPQPFEFKKSSLTETVRRSAQFASYQNNLENANEKTHIELNLPKSALIVPHDADRIEDAVLNLIINAQQAVSGKPDGKITVRLSKTKNASSESKVMIEVKDNGCGIPRENIRRIFTPFYTTNPNGTGLGLTAVRRIVQAHGGNCKVRSVGGRGSVFTITLPTKNRTDLYEAFPKNS